MGSSDKEIATKQFMAGILSSGSVLSENQKLPQHFSWQMVYFHCQRWGRVSYMQMDLQGDQPQMAKSIKLLFLNYEFFYYIWNNSMKHIYWCFVMYKICMKQMIL